ncbi:hypothetical protein SISSUDRAFT_1066355 [Sistotremastrum suecicum HHB10207 ss-3]|uniref:DUF6535 domain-containing protein n=1 Tax=Sistotremastrum suecicum HHB10207 ss-3 TaxID=1314776 RepID=A0A165YEN9_9AGAM|nr:hypothetical protein SISSUDRAFT_1066355 [Sistotremastrum suecicum HHB10207 ss-3]
MAMDPTESTSASNKPIVDALLELNKTMKRVQKTLVDHGKKFDILTRDAVKDDQPYDQRPCSDESTCTALYEMAMAKTKEEVEEWIKRMDVSLVFIALFSAVLTAFIIPATQNLFPSNVNSDSTSDLPPLPPTSDQDICLLYYLALINAILDAVLSVLARQWMSRLTTRPEGANYRERLLRHKEREELAKKWLKYLVEGLYLLLLSSIALFISGLLYQLRNLATSFDETSPRLLLIWNLGLGLSSIVVLVVFAATMHAVLYEASPFGGPFSKMILKFAVTCKRCVITLLALREVIKTVPAVTRAPISKASKAVLHPCQHLRWHKVMNPPFLLHATEISRHIRSLFSSALPLFSRRKAKIDDSYRKLVGLCMELISEASDPKLLERAVASFSFSEWFSHYGKDQESMSQLEKTMRRLTATDTSNRVRETVNDRFSRFATQSSQASSKDGQSLPIADDLITFFASRCSFPSEFTTRVLYTSFGKDNADLRALTSLSTEECIGRVLCSYDWLDEYANTYLPKTGERKDIFRLAHDHCYDLFSQGREADVMRILSTVNSRSLTRSFCQGHDRSGVNVRWELYHFFFRQRILSVSQTPDNADLLPLESLPLEHAIANALCSYDGSTRSGTREEIFGMAEDYCNSLLQIGKEDDVLQILSIVDRVSIVRSYFQCQPNFFPQMIGFVAGNCDIELVREVNEFMVNAEYPSVDPLAVSYFLTGLPPTVSLTCDLSCFLRFLSDYRYDIVWREASVAAVSWLEAYAVSKASNRPAVRRFLQCCIEHDLRDVNGDICETGEDTRDRARSLLDELDRLPPQTQEVMSDPNTSSEPLPGLDIVFSSAAALDDNIDADDGDPASDTQPASASRPPERDGHGPTMSAIVQLSEAAATLLPPSRSHSLEAALSDSVFEASPRLENAQTN